MKIKQATGQVDAASPQPLDGGEHQPSAQLFEPLLDDVQTARLLGVHPKTLQRMARNGEVPAHRVGRFWRYRASELDVWLRSPKTPAQSAVSSDKIILANTCPRE